MNRESGTIDLDRVEIRDFRPEDKSAVQRLYDEGLLVGQIPANDTAADIENIVEAYLEPERAHFWIAEYEDQVLGMVGVAEDEQDVAEIRRLRVDPRWQGKGIEGKLMETALGFCRHHHYLKVVLDTHMQPGSAIALFDRFAFQHHRTRAAHGKETLEFFLDLYREPRLENDEPSGGNNSDR